MADLAQVGEDVVDGVQEAAEALGNFISALGKFGKEWFIDFVGQIVDKVVDAGEGVTNLAAEVGSFPDGLGADDVTGGVLKELTDIVTGLFEDLADDIASTAEQVGSAVIAFLGDEDMYAGLFGILKDGVVNTLDACRGRLAASSD